jgi:hypothetical protein
MTNGKNTVWREMVRSEEEAAAGRKGPSAAEIAFDIDEQPILAFGTTLTERKDLPIAQLPKPEVRHVPPLARLRLMWHRHIVRDLQH